MCLLSVFIEDLQVVDGVCYQLTRTYPAEPVAPATVAPMPPCPPEGTIEPFGGSPPSPPTSLVPTIFEQDCPPDPVPLMLVGDAVPLPPRRFRMIPEMSQD